MEFSLKKAQQYTKAQNIKRTISASLLAEELLDEIAKFVKPGKKESDVKKFALSLFKEQGIEKLWHQPFIRFNDHTLYTYKHFAKEDYVLKEEDIAFIDIGIVKDGVEGDAGKTLVFGDVPNYLHLQKTSETIFGEAVSYWENENPTGIDLYHYIETLCDKYDVCFNLDPAGHLIGLFPHVHAWKEGLNHFSDRIDPAHWILEIQIKDKEKPYGAFFENLLV